MKRLITVISVAALAATAVAAPVAARSPFNAGIAAHTDNVTTPLSARQVAMKQAAQELVLNGQAKGKGKNKVVKIAPGQFVELAFEGEDQILTLLGEFSDTAHSVTGGAPGPLHNQIPEPDREVDNTTIWAPDFNVAHYDELLYSKTTFPSMANFYLEQSSGKYSVDGHVGDWVQVSYNEARYGTNLCGGIVCSTVWDFIEEQSDLWWNDLVADTGSVAAANEFLETFDIWDRYDIDGDGDFNEPDGYIDHFQSVHAGEGEETGGGAQGANAIWSHRWYAFFNAAGPDGPGPNGFGGVRIGDSDYWIGDYTIEPENGGVGVFAHEFAHDLNIPDLYDTSGNTGGAENSTGFWTIMSSGSYGSQNGIDLGSAPMHFGVWEKFQLGFLKSYSVATNNSTGTYHLGPAEYNTKKPQAMFIVLPNKVVPLDLGDPCAECGTTYFYSGSGNNLNNTMTKSIAGGGALTAKVRYEIEFDWDYAFLESSSDGGATWDPVLTSESQTDSDGQSGFNTSRTGMTGDTDGDWVDLTASIPAGADAIRFRYQTDGAVADPGFQVDNIAIDGTLIGTAETDEGWVFDGFRTTTGSETQEFFNAYVLENRQYIGYDVSLDTGPYNFVPGSSTFVEHFPYQDGLLISYWDDSHSDNNVGDHPGEGLLLPVDSHPEIETWNDGSQMRPRLQSYDSTFTKSKTEAVSLLGPGGVKTISSKPGVRVFNDSLRDGDGTSIYWAPGHSSDNPSGGRYQAEWNSVNVPDTGTVVRVKSISSSGMMVLDLNK